MAGDLIREVRRGTLTHLKADPASVALVPAPNMHPSTTPPTPSWPFSRMDSFQSTAVLDTAEDQASRMGTAFKIAIHNKRVPIDGGWSARLKVRSVRLLRDGDEESAYHAILSVEARVLAA
jgi:hypothetical protein